MRSPGRVPPRRPLPDDAVRALIATAETLVLEAHAICHREDTGSGARIHRAEQDLLLVRVAADTGARRGELAALRLSDLRGRVLTIERAVSAGQLTTPKSGHGRTLTVGSSTAELWHHLVQQWTTRAGGPLGHADAATTLREYAHALPLTDAGVADAIDRHLHAPDLQTPAGTRNGHVAEQER